MREIKFRAWDKERERMIFQHEMNNSLENKEYYFSLSEDRVELLYHDEDYSAYVGCKAEIMQYTGIKDINGKEIYEGDIVKFLDEEMIYSDCGIEYDEFINTGKVIFSHDELMGWDITNRHMDLEEVWHYREYIEVVGNTYENPELLEGE